MSYKVNLCLRRLFCIVGCGFILYKANLRLRSLFCAVWATLCRRKRTWLFCGFIIITYFWFNDPFSRRHEILRLFHTDINIRLYDNFLFWFDLTILIYRVADMDFYDNFWIYFVLTTLILRDSWYKSLW